MLYAVFCFVWKSILVVEYRTIKQYFAMNIYNKIYVIYISILTNNKTHFWYIVFLDRVTGSGVLGRKKFVSFTNHQAGKQIKPCLCSFENCLSINII